MGHQPLTSPSTTQNLHTNHFFARFPSKELASPFFTWLGLGPISSHHLASPPVFLQPRQQRHLPCLVQRQATTHPPWHQTSIQTTQRTSFDPSIDHPPVCEPPRSTTTGLKFHSVCLRSLQRDGENKNKHHSDCFFHQATVRAECR